VKKYVAVLVFIGLALALYWWLNRQATLVQLQQKYLAAKDDGDRNRVIDQLEKYYLHLSVEDSIRKRIEQNVAAVVDTSNPDLSDFDDGWDSSDISALETRLKELLKAAMIVCAQSSPQACAAFLKLAQEKAAFVDGKTQHQYWTAVVKRMKGYSKKEALAYLWACKAAAMCAKWIDGNYQTAEQSGALAFRYITIAPNERLRLEVLQRFQYILFLFRNLNVLSIALAERNWPAAEKIGDYLRMAGILLHQAEAYRSGEIKKSLELCQRIQKLAHEHKDISAISWYQKSALMFTAEAYWQLGDYEKAQAVILETEKLNLLIEEIGTLTTLKGLLSQSLGKYEIAESEFKRAITLADSVGIVFNKIQYRINLGNLYQDLTEYELASNFYVTAAQMLSESNLEQSAAFIEALYHRGQMALTTEETQTQMLEILIKHTKRVLNAVNSPPRTSAILHYNLGQLHFALENYEHALNELQAAENICERNGLQFLGEVKIHIAKALLHLKRFDSAEEKAEEAILWNQQEEDETAIDALAIKAEIEYRKGNLNQAIAITNKIIFNIEEVSRRFVQSNRLAAFRQKMYDYLKQAVLYEIYRNRLDSAFIKLDYAKSRQLKRYVDFGNGDSHYLNLESMKNNLGEQEIIIDYMLSSDTVYTFALTPADLFFMKKKVNSADLKKNVYALLDNINKTINILKNYEPTSIRQHFTENTKLAKSLFEKLMGWPELGTLINNAEIIYLVPDEFLCQVPFATLVFDTTKEARYLAEKVALAYLPAVSFLQPHSKMADAKELRNKRVLVSANPGIPGVGELVAFLHKTFPLTEEMQTNSTPSKQEIIDQLNASHDIYILVGHGAANPTDPERSQMEFTITNSQTRITETFWLTIADLKQTSWYGADMVMLVGCETGSGKVYRGTGMAGIQQWLVSMGAKNVLGSLWKVDAVQTIDQIEDFFRKWQNNGKPARALQSVQFDAIRKFRQNNNFIFPHPYFWGANNLIL